MPDRARAAAIMFGAVAAPHPSQQTLLQPSGKWTVEYDQDMCVLRRQFGEGDDVVTLGIRPLPLGESDEFVVMTHKRQGSESGHGTVTLQPSGKTIESTYESYRLHGGDGSLTTLSLEHDDLGALPESTQISISAGRAAEVTLAPNQFPAALAALKTCQDDLLRGWGIDPAVQDKIAVRPKADYASYFTSAAYPARGQQGIVITVFRVGLDGRATDCRVVSSSHSAGLDEGTCAIITKKVHFTPAIGKDGKPMAAMETIRVNWRLES
jgi:TonB family protein